MGETILQRLAARAVAVERQSLSDASVARAKALIVDTVGCALGAVASPVVRGCSASSRRSAAIRAPR